jgi:hypothetical protein
MGSFYGFATFWQCKTAKRPERLNLFFFGLHQYLAFVKHVAISVIICMMVNMSFSCGLTGSDLWYFSFVVRTACA